MPKILKSFRIKIVVILRNNKTLKYAARIRHTPAITQRMEFLKEVPGRFFYSAANSWRNYLLTKAQKFRVLEF